MIGEIFRYFNVSVRFNRFLAFFRKGINGTLNKRLDYLKYCERTVLFFKTFRTKTIKEDR